MTPKKCKPIAIGIHEQHRLLVFSYVTPRLGTLYFRGWQASWRIVHVHCSADCGNEHESEKELQAKAFWDDENTSQSRSSIAQQTNSRHQSEQEGKRPIPILTGFTRFQSETADPLLRPGPPRQSFPIPQPAKPRPRLTRRIAPFSDMA